MSQVFEEVIEIPLQELVEQSTDVVLAKNLGVKKEFARVVFSKKTHYKKEEETIYTEEVEKFEVLKTYKAGNLKVGDQFWLRKENDYSLEAIELYHKEDILESPISMVYKPRFVVNKNTPVLFLNKIDDQEYKNLYQSYNDAMEGEAVETDVQKIVRKDGK